MGLISPAAEGQKKPKSSAKENGFILQKSSDEQTKPVKVDLKSLQRPLSDKRLAARQKRLEAFAKGSSLVFHGKVIGKSYGRTRFDKSYFSNVPVTFVEFQVIEVLAGEYDGDRFIVRYMGGQKNEDEFLLVTHINNFNIGDEEIISLNGNGYVMDPVIGRFRVFEDDVHTASGLKVLTGGSGDDLLVSNERAKSRTLDQIQIGSESFSGANNLPVESPDGDQEIQAAQRESVLRPVKSGEIKRMIRENIIKSAQTFTIPEESASPALHREFKNAKKQ